MSTQIFATSESDPTEFLDGQPVNLLERKRQTAERLYKEQNRRETETKAALEEQRNAVRKAVQGLEEAASRAKTLVDETKRVLEASEKELARKKDLAQESNQKLETLKGEEKAAKDALDRLKEEINVLEKQKPEDENMLATLAIEAPQKESELEKKRLTAETAEKDLDKVVGVARQAHSDFKKVVLDKENAATTAKDDLKKLQHSFDAAKRDLEEKKKEAEAKSKSGEAQEVEQINAAVESAAMDLEEKQMSLNAASLDAKEKEDAHNIASVEEKVMKAALDSAEEELKRLSDETKAALKDKENEVKRVEKLRADVARRDAELKKKQADFPVDAEKLRAFPALIEQTEKFDLEMKAAVNAAELELKNKRAAAEDAEKDEKLKIAAADEAKKKEKESENAFVFNSSLSNTIPVNKGSLCCCIEIDPNMHKYYTLATSLACFPVSTIMCNQLWGPIFPCLPCCNQYHCRYMHYPDFCFFNDFYSGETGNTNEGNAADPPTSSLSSAELAFLDYCRRLAEMSYEADLISARAFAETFLPGQVKELTYWTNSPVVAFTCLCLVPSADGTGAPVEKFAVIFQGTVPTKSKDVWFDMLSSHTTDFFASNGSYLGRAALGFLLGYNMFRRQDSPDSRLEVRTEGPASDFQSLRMKPAYELGGAGLVAYAKAKAQSRPVLVVGHSLGGSMAQLFSADFALSGFAEHVQLVTFGSPRALGHQLAKSKELLKKVTHTRLVNSFDPIPRFPIYGRASTGGGIIDWISLGVPMLMVARIYYLSSVFAWYGMDNPRHIGYRNYSYELHRLCQFFAVPADDDDTGTTSLRKANLDLLFEGKVLGITRHWGRVVYAYSEEAEKALKGSVVWRDVNYEDFQGSDKLRKTLKESNKEAEEQLQSRQTGNSVCFFLRNGPLCLFNECIPAVPGGIPLKAEVLSHSLGATGDPANSVGTYASLITSAAPVVRKIVISNLTEVKVIFIYSADPRAGRVFETISALGGVLSDSDKQVVHRKFILSPGEKAQILCPSAKNNSISIIYNDEDAEEGLPSARILSPCTTYSVGSEVTARPDMLEDAEILLHTFKNFMSRLLFQP